MRCNSKPSQIVNLHDILKELEEINDNDINIEEALMVSMMKKEAEELKNAICELKKKHNTETIGWNDRIDTKYTE